MKIAIICSAGGSAFFSAFDILVQTKRFNQSDFIVITDRECKAEQEALNRGIPLQRVEFKTKREFSKEVASLLIGKQVSLVLMIYSRLISSELYLQLPTLNIHPALLPAFKGMNAVGQALDAEVKFLGASIHLTTERMDDGHIVGQVSSPVSKNANKEQLEKLSFLQKTYLIVMAIDSLQLNLLKVSTEKIQNLMDPICFSPSANPCIQSSDLMKLFSVLQKSEGMQDAIK